MQINFRSGDEHIFSFPAPNGQRIIPRISSNGSDGLMVDFTPTMTGENLFKNYSFIAKKIK